MPAVAITDTGNLFGALEFSQACAAKGIQPIIGCQLALTRADNPRLAARADRAAGAGRDRPRQPAAPVLARLPRHRPRPEAAAPVRRASPQHAAGLILLTGGTTGPLARLLAEGQRPKPSACSRQFAEAFPDRTVVELHRHGLPLEPPSNPA